MVISEEPYRQERSTYIDNKTVFAKGKATLIAYDDKANVFYVHPEQFARKVIETITGDFSTYEGPGSPFHPLPQIRQGGYSGYP